MATLQRLAALAQAEKQGTLKPEQRAILAELRQRAKSKNQTLAQYIEPVLSIASSAIAEPVSGFVGMAGLPMGVDAASSAVQRTQDALTYKPKSEAGQKGMQKLGGFMQGVADKANPIAAGTVASLYDAIPLTKESSDDIYKRLPKQGLSGDLGALVADKTGSPALATLAHTLPTAALELAGLKGASKIPGKQLEFGDVGGQSFKQRGAVGGVKPFSGVVDNIPAGSAYKGKVYHSTDADFDAFDFDKSADGTAWFSSDKSELTREGSAAAAAAGRGRVIEADVELSKVAGWDEIDRYSIDELIQLGYDGAILDGDIQVFKPEAIKGLK